MVDAVMPVARTKKNTTALEPVSASSSPLPDATGYVLTKQVNLAQLASEINALLPGNTQVNLAVTSGDQDVLWVTPAGVNAQLLAQAIEDHLPDPKWGVFQQAAQNFVEAMAKVRDDPDVKLTPADRDVLLKGMALHFSAITGGG